MPRILVVASLLALAPAGLQAGSLALYVSGEDLATRGFEPPKLTRDGWALQFSRIIVSIDQVTAWQTDPPFMADTAAIEGKPLGFSGPFLVDLVDADDEDRVLLDTVAAAPGHYNALSWALVPAQEGAFAGYALILEGLARRNDVEVPFTLRSSDSLMHACGEYLGDARKGFVSADSGADLEITLHLDHLFGRADKDAADDMNLSAPGFDPFAAGGDQDFALDGLHIGHVGEGHCHVSPL